MSIPPIARAYLPSERKITKINRYCLIPFAVLRLGQRHVRMRRTLWNASGEFEFLSVDARRALAHDRRRQGLERERDFALGIVHDDRFTNVAAFAQFRVERNLPEQRDTELLGETRAAARSEDLVALRVVAGEPTHVLDDATHAE